MYLRLILTDNAMSAAVGSQELLSVSRVHQVTQPILFEKKEVAVMLEVFLEVLPDKKVTPRSRQLLSRFEVSESGGTQDKIQSLYPTFFPDNDNIIVVS